MKIIVFEQKKSAELKIAGVREHGRDVEFVDIVSIDQFLPDFIDEPEEFISDDFDCDLVLNYLKHPDLSHCLVEICEKKGIPVVTPAGKGGGFTPFTCCGLGKNDRLGAYGSLFGLPEYRVSLKGDVISDIVVVRGAPCGATWDGLENIIGCTVKEALSKLPRQVQYFCSADPSGFDPVSGKSPVHYAGYVHIAALKKAIDQAVKDS